MTDEPRRWRRDPPTHSDVVVVGGVITIWVLVSGGISLAVGVDPGVSLTITTVGLAAVA